MFQPMSGGELSLLKQALAENLKKSATVGYQTPASGGGTLGALVPQSIENTLSNATYKSQQAVLWKDIPKTPAAQTVHEYVRITEHGVEGLSPFFAEGGVPGTNRSVYERASAKIKFVGEKREVTDVASMVGLLGANPQALAEETTRGTMSLLKKIEHSLYYGDEDMSDVEWDGIFKQMDDGASSNVTDLQGGTISASILQDVCGEVYSAPYYGEPDTIYMEPRLYSEMIKQSVQHGRHDQLKTRDGSKVTFGAQNGIMAPYGFVDIKAAPFLFNSPKAPTTGFGDYIPATPTLSVGIAAAPAGSSLFVAADAGDYIYKVIAVSDTGYSIPLTTSAVTVAAGDGVTFTIADPSDALVTHYRIYRTPVDGLAASAVLIARVAASGATAVSDVNANRPNSSRVLFAQNDKEIYEFARLLDLIRRPLHSLTTTRPFLLMMFGTPIVKVPTKMWVLKNALANTAL